MALVDYFSDVPSSLMAVPFYNAQGGSYIREGELKIMGNMGSQFPWKKDYHAIKGKWEVTKQGEPCIVGEWGSEST